MKLLNKKAIITGGSRGFGKEIAAHFIREGGSVSICSRNNDELDLTIKELTANATGRQTVCGLCADVADYSRVETFVKYSVERLGTVDCLVNNAGIYGPKGNVDEVDLDKWVLAFQINVMGVMNFCKAVIPYMKKNNGGKIINLSGGGATSPMPGVSAYAATKAAVVRLTETIALELKSVNIFVNAVAPGALNTGMLDEMLAEGRGKVSTAFYEKALKQKETEIAETFRHRRMG
ncbi:MAG: SDR family oxidoreductase, partial [Clostridiales bacterium]|nr:SDR family oxidoreductase [Clostridiales bacterium]